MAMKQTQTKLFDFSDVGLDFCAGSKNLFPDRFKKMLALGYNEQTVSSVAVAGNQVTLSYGVPHGYVADRVLKVSAPELLGINGGEFFIDSVTANTVTMTIDGAPASIAGNFTTKVASLGWEPVYEQAHIHIYKFKHIDESDLYLRICFQTNPSHRNAIVVAVGKTADLALGTINDINVPGNLGTVTNSNNASPNILWDFTDAASSTPNNYTYSQGASTYGRGVLVGSLYHIATMINSYSANNEDSRAGARCLFSVLPTYCFNYENLNYPIVIGDNQGSTSITKPSTQSNTGFLAYVGLHRVAIDIAKKASDIELYYPQAEDSILPPSIDTFNTTTSRPIQLFEYSTKQFIGFISGGLQTLSIGPLNMPVLSSVNTSPIFTKDIDLDSNVCVHGIGRLWVAVPIEEIKIA